METDMETGTETGHGNRLFKKPQSSKVQEGSSKGSSKGNNSVNSQA
jgi:hypothetical protein